MSQSHKSVNISFEPVSDCVSAPDQKLQVVSPATDYGSGVKPAFGEAGGSRLSSASDPWLTARTGLPELRVEETTLALAELQISKRSSLLQPPKALDFCGDIAGLV